MKKFNKMNKKIINSMKYLKTEMKTIWLPIFLRKINKIRIK